MSRDYRFVQGPRCMIRWACSPYFCCSDGIYRTDNMSLDEQRARCTVVQRIQGFSSGSTPHHVMRVRPPPVWQRLGPPYSPGHAIHGKSCDAWPRTQPGESLPSGRHLEPNLQHWLSVSQWRSTRRATQPRRVDPDSLPATEELQSPLGARGP